MSDATLTALRRLVDERFGGVLKRGKHPKNGKCCALECLSVLRGIPWTDDPEELRTFDLRNLNDIYVSDYIRAEYLLPVMAAYNGSLDWPAERQAAVAAALVVGVVNVLIADLLGLPDKIRRVCREARNCREAQASVSSGLHESVMHSALLAASMAASMTASAAVSARLSAGAAAQSALTARSVRERERIFIAACQVWLDAAKAGN